MTALPRPESASSLPVARITLRRVAVRRGPDADRPRVAHEIARDDRAEDSSSARDSASFRTSR